jgi:hypothetical protein
VYCKTFRYKLKPDKLSSVIEISKRIDSQMRSFSEDFQKYTLIREIQDHLEILELYFFEDWDSWRRLMEKTSSDSRLEELWENFERLIEGEVSEEDWELLE